MSGDPSRPIAADLGDGGCLGEPQPLEVLFAQAEVMTHLMPNGDLNLFDQIVAIATHLLEILLEQDHSGEIIGRARNLRFDRELISRYRATLVGREKLNGRMAYLLEFEPKSKKLPVNHRIDYALNNSRGQVWIDAEDYGVARIEFHLMKRPSGLGTKL